MRQIILKTKECFLRQQSFRTLKKVEGFKIRAENSYLANMGYNNSATLVIKSFYEKRPGVYMLFNENIHFSDSKNFGGFADILKSKKSSEEYDLMMHFDGFSLLDTALISLRELQPYLEKAEAANKFEADIETNLPVNMIISDYTPSKSLIESLDLKIVYKYKEIFDGLQHSLQRSLDEQLVS